MWVNRHPDGALTSEVPHLFQDCQTAAGVAGITGWVSHPAAPRQPGAYSFFRARTALAASAAESRAT